MRLRQHAVRLGSLGAVFALAATACGGGSGGGTSSSTQTTSSSGKKGGTLNVLLIADFEHLDPQRNYVGSALNFGTRLLYRTLTAYQSKPGAAGSQIVPDLATDLGRPSNGGKTWEFTLKDGVKYEDGTPITCTDLKYGVERSFSSQITDGPQYAQAYLANSASYRGPYVGGNNGGKGLSSITCKDQKTIVYQLGQPVGDFNYTVTLPQFSPVPQAKDTNVKYDNRPFSSGPYKIESYTRQKQITLVRNTQWDPKTDPIRKALPDKVVGVFGLDPSVIDQRLMADAPSDQTAVMLDSNIQAENISTVTTDPTMKKRLIAGLSGFTRYLAINTAKVKDLKVRQAIEYAIDKESYRGTRGGKDAGDFANSMITPLLTSYKKFDVYPAPATGDQAKAKALLTAAGALGTKLTIDIANTPTNAKSAAAFKEALGKAGFNVTINPINTDVFYTTIGKRATENELALVGWGPDWTNGSSVIPPLFDGRLLVPEGNNNYAQLNDPAINAGIATANQETDLTKQATLWGDLDQKVLEDAAVVPLIYDRNNQLQGSKVTGGFLHSFFGQADFATLGVS
ncbi:MAG: peptide/nickel transport system substrate-binding protein [Actinomycetota bacterium]|jgi:peptide/nickel transport system substrate-binding protein|nr:peptide/nickel transport system substrate-binding protein [Actinomycetota bacterium]